MKYKSQSLREKGITLVALVVTIIVLLILAGVTISLALNNNGVIQKVKEASNVSFKKTVQETVQMAWMAVSIDGEKEGWDRNTLAEKLEEELNDSSVTVEGENLIVNYEGIRTIINLNDETTTSEESKIKIEEFSIVGTTVKEENIPLPNGFTHIEGTKDTGYVIQDGDGNEFVWVPVDKNQKIRLKVSSEENITEIKLIDPIGEEISLANASGMSYENNNIEPTYNGGYQVEVNTASDTVKKTLVVRSLYALDSYENKPTTTTNLNYYSEDDAYREKIQQNGGFYVGRYEVIYVNNKPASKPSTSSRTVSNVALVDNMLWNYIYYDNALEKAKEFNPELNSSLLTGPAWDRVMGWIVQSGDKNLDQIKSKCETWGNFSDDTFSETTGIINTGSFEQTKAKNIYDLAGNLGEWVETSYKSFRRRSV
ncbi:MAG: hypothetical protein IKG14_01470 [Clostridia bacterium]|nr:hypothetical protein [Clostridia bacterium]